MITLLFDSRTLSDLHRDEESYVLFKVKDEGNGYQTWEEHGVAGSETCVEEMVPEGEDGDEYACVKVTHSPYRFRYDPESTPELGGDMSEEQIAMVRKMLDYSLRDIERFEELTDAERTIVGSREMFDWLKTWVRW